MSYTTKKRPACAWEPELRREALEYIEWHEGPGSRPELINFVCDPEGDAVILVRYIDANGVKNANGTKMSGFLNFMHMYSEDGKIKWDVSERCVFPRTSENDYVASLEGSVID